MMSFVMRFRLSQNEKTKPCHRRLTAPVPSPPPSQVNHRAGKRQMHRASYSLNKAEAFLAASLLSGTKVAASVSASASSASSPGKPAGAAAAVAAASGVAGEGDDEKKGGGGAVIEPVRSLAIAKDAGTNGPGRCDLIGFVQE